jgi:6,7-dimethyl-8-ribityllumazine synthase
MLNNVNIGRYVDPGDWSVLTKFLEAIGFVRNVPDKEVLGFQTASFAAPLAAISLTSWPSELPQGLAKNARNAAFLIGLETSDPSLIYEAAQGMKLRVGLQDSEIEWSAEEPFSVSLPGNIILGVQPMRERSQLSGNLNASGRRFGIVVSRFNSFITDRLLQSACDGLLRSGAHKNDLDVVRVPGAFEIPLAARKLAETGKYDAIICLGCLLRGDTAHYDVIVNEVTRGIGQSAQETGVPHAFGVLTCENLEQAIDRAGLKMGNKGFEAALAAVEMASLGTAIGLRASGSGRQRSGGKQQSSAIGEKQVPRFARNDKVNARNDKPNRNHGSKKIRTAKTKRK